MGVEVKNLVVAVGDVVVVDGVSLSLEAGKVHALLGPNGSGKSSLAHAIMGHPKYRVCFGTVLVDGEDVTALSPDKRAKKGLFLSFQYPVAVEGVRLRVFLRTAAEQLHGVQYHPLEFDAVLKNEMRALKMDPSFLKRHLNVGFSGGEKKRLEMLQLRVLKPAYALLDETDSGLDVDAIKVVAETVKELCAKGMGVLVISHYHQFLRFLDPAHVSVMVKGKIVASGGRELAQQIEERGFMEVVHDSH